MQPQAPASLQLTPRDSSVMASAQAQRSSGVPCVWLCSSHACSASASSPTAACISKQVHQGSSPC